MFVLSSDTDTAHLTITGPTKSVLALLSTKARQFDEVNDVGRDIETPASHGNERMENELEFGQSNPGVPEVEAVGPSTMRIRRGTSDFESLLVNRNPDILFDTCETSSDNRLMTKELKAAVDTLAGLVRNEWPRQDATMLRVIKGWTQAHTDGTHSPHYEVRRGRCPTLAAGRIQTRTTVAFSRACWLRLGLFCKPSLFAPFRKEDQGSPANVPPLRRVI